MIVVLSTINGGKIMKQFSLKAYLDRPDRKVMTRNGRSVRIICTNRLDEDYPIIALVSSEDLEDLLSYTKGGKLYKNQNDDRDLFFVGVKKEGWINLYKFNSVIAPGTKVYDTEENAKSEIGNKSENYISTIKIKWEE